MGRPAAYSCSVRLFTRVAATGFLASLLGACGLITGLSDYSTGGAVDASLTTRHDGSTSGNQEAASVQGADGAGDDGPLSEGTDGGASEDGDAEIATDGAFDDANEDASEDGEVAEGGGVNDAAVEAGGGGSVNDAAPEAGGGMPEAGGTHDAGCGTPDTIANCGACGVSCNTSHSADAGCSGESCTYACSPGYADCTSGAPNTDGCETQTNTTSNCSGCNVACSTTTGTASCNGVKCSYACSSGLADCNASAAPDTDGCETATNTTAHCAGCSACNTTTGTPSCNGTTCSYACDSLLLDCNASTAPDLDGCETSATSTSTCGGCLNKCGATNAGTFSADGCNGTSCSYTCSAGHYDCDYMTAPNTDGCETAESTSNCGACGQACGATNSNTFSADSCSDTTNSCSYTCGSGYYDCNASTAPDTDGCETPESTTNCGKCGQACNTTTGTPSCASGATSCSYACNSLRRDCNAGTAPDTDGCECAGTACCSGSSCQTAHSNGISSGASETYYDCSAVNTHSQTEAQAACQAYTGGSCTQTSTCCGAEIVVCLGTTSTAYCGTYSGTSYCWEYGSVDSGNVTTGTSAACSGSVATWN